MEISNNAYSEMIYRIGRNVPNAGSISETIGSEEAQGCKCIQFFIGGRISSNIPKPNPIDISFAKDLCKFKKMTIYVHSQYCINLGPPADDPVVIKWSPTLNSLVEYVKDLPCSVILHMGSGCTSRKVEATPEQFIENTLNAFTHKKGRQRPSILIENMCGCGTKLGNTWDEIRSVFEILDNPKQQGVGFCFDTCHGFAAGVSHFDTHESIVRLFEEADSIIDGGINMIHLNDSKDKFYSKKDHHECIGEGNIWGTKESKEGLMSLLEICKDRGIDLNLETPDPPRCLNLLWGMLPEKHRPKM